MNTYASIIRRKAGGILLLAALAAVIIVSAASAQDASTKPPVGITVNGHGEAMAAPDMAYVSLGILTRDASASKAAAENARIAQAITSAVKGLGIPDRDIQTQNYSIQPWMEYVPNASPKQLGYETRNTIRVTVRDIKKVGGVVDAGVKAGANEVQGISFDIANDQPIKREALTSAVKDAKQKAETIAATLGVKVGAPTSVSETSYRPPVPMFKAAALEAAPTPISPGEMTVSQDVTVTFAILP